VSTLKRRLREDHISKWTAVKRALLTKEQAQSALNGQGNIVLGHKKTGSECSVLMSTLYRETAMVNIMGFPTSK